MRFGWRSDQSNASAGRRPNPPSPAFSVVMTMTAMDRTTEALEAPRVDLRGTCRSMGCRRVGGWPNRSLIEVAYSMIGRRPPEVVVINVNLFDAGSLTEYRTSQKFAPGQYQEEASSRIQGILPQLFAEMKEHPVMPVAGRGFYVVSKEGRWRIGYGIHNPFLLPFEQAGIAAFLASLWLWWRLGTRLGRRRPGPNESPIDVHVRGALFGYFIALMVVGWAGGHFWMKGATEHLNSYLILMLGLALTETGGEKSTSSVSPVAENQSGLSIPFLQQ